MTQYIRNWTSDTPGERPDTGELPKGAVGFNRPDRQLFVGGPEPVDYLPIRQFSPEALYVAGDLIATGGAIYRATRSLPAGEFNPDDWAAVTNLDAFPGLGLRAHSTAQALRDAGPGAPCEGRVTLGALSVGDGGGGPWRWDPDSMEDDNLGTVLLPTGHVGAGRYLRPRSTTRPEMWGDSNTALQAAIDWVAALGGGAVLLYGRTYEHNGLHLPSGVYLIGEGPEATCLRLADGANTDSIKSTDFDALTGTNSWYVGTEGVHHGFGIINLRIDGNKNNQTSGDGVKFYGKNYTIHNVIIHDCYQDGFYSEAANKVGQVDYRDLPESWIGPLWCRNNGRHGVLFRGPHDACFHYYVGCFNGGSPFRNEISSGVYDGFCKIGFMHCYNDAEEIYFGQAVWAHGQIICDGDHLHISDTANNSVINQIRTIGSGLVHTSPAVQIDAASCRISQINASCAAEATVDGVVINGARTLISQAYVFGGAGSGVGIKFTSNSGESAIEQAHVRNFSATGGIGVQIGSDAAVSYCEIGGQINDCATGLDYANQGGRNRVRLSVFSNSGQTQITGAAPAATDRFDLVTSGTQQRFTENAFEPAGSVVLSNSAVQTFTVPHGLAYTPDINKCSVALKRVDSVNDFEMAYISIVSVDAANIVIEAKVATTSATVGATAKLAISVRV